MEVVNMNRYLIIKLIFADEILDDVHDVKLDEYPQISQKIENFANSLGATALFEVNLNYLPIGRPFATVEHNFYLSDDEKVQLISYLREYFYDGEIKYRTMDIFNILSAVRFVKTDGEVFELN